MINVVIVAGTLEFARSVAMGLFMNLTNDNKTVDELVNKIHIAYRFDGSIRTEKYNVTYMPMSDVPKYTSIEADIVIGMPDDYRNEYAFMITVASRKIDFVTIDVIADRICKFEKGDINEKNYIGY